MSSASSEVTIKLVENTHAFEADDGSTLWCNGYTPVDDDGSFLAVADYRTSDPRCFFCRVAGVSHRPRALQDPGLTPGSQVILRAESENEHDQNAIAVWDGTATVQIGYIPASLAAQLSIQCPRGVTLTEHLGGVIITEYRRGSQIGPRVGLHLIVGPVGDIALSIQSDDDESQLNAGVISNQFNPHTSEGSQMATVNCPACGSTEQSAAGVGGFRCKACQRDAWIIKCRKCHRACTFYGSATGTGALAFRCENCRTRNVVEKQRLRAISAEARRVERAAAVARREAAAQGKALKAMHVEERQDEAAQQNAELQARLLALGDVLAAAALAGSAFVFAALKAQPEQPEFQAGELETENAPPAFDDFIPAPAHGLSSLLPGAKRKIAQAHQAAEAAYEASCQEYERTEAERKASLAAARQEFDRRVAEFADKVRRQHAAVEELERRVTARESDAVAEYIMAALAAMALPYELTAPPRVAYSQLSRQLVIELALPGLEVIPEAREYRYVKTRDEIMAVAMPVSERRRRYASLIAQVALRTLREAFAAESHGVFETVVVNGHVSTVDRRTGQDIKPCLVTVRTTRERFEALDLTKVDSIECLKGLSASVSRSPAELVPVRPVIEFDMADPRFVKEEQVLETLDTRPNLMELSPQEFESLITNLFEKMGLETKLTQASRDGGVDCVAYDARPIFGGKVVVQAKRYKNTVGVSAVRDLFGTMQNEGATKGILVTTSGYGQASHDFANGKPLELIDGGNLLYLLQEHAAIDAKIEIPEDWVDPQSGV